MNLYQVKTYFGSDRHWKFIDEGTVLSPDAGRIKVSIKWGKHRKERPAVLHIARELPGHKQLELDIV